MKTKTKLTPKNIMKNICPYVFVVIDEITNGLWVFYDGNAADRFITEHTKKYHHRMVKTIEYFKDFE